MSNLVPKPVHLEFEEVAHESAEAVAVRFRGDVLHYGELNQWANLVAWGLIHQGIVPGSRVALLVEASLLTPVAILGILKAGAAYVPVSPSYPEQRIAYILEDAEVSIVLTLEKLRELLGLTAQASASPEVAELSGFSPERARNPDLSVAPGQIAYILYTSGSTGSPKGVVVSHRSLSYYLGWHRGYLRSRAGEVDLPLTASMCFAAGVTQLYTPLLLGRTLHVIPPETVRQPDLLLGWYAEHADFGLYCVPTLWNELVSFAASTVSKGLSIRGPRCVFLSGEPVSAALLERSRALWPEIQFWNLYGPTEATANGTAGELRTGQPVTLGEAIHGTKIYLVDSMMQEVRPGEEGEICICGPGVAEGYVNRPELTADRFLRNPFDPSCQNRLFRTGDLGMLNAAGELHFLGRKDFQVKIRGFRIECGEIEATLLQHPSVRQAVVDQRTDRELNKRLVAWVTFHPARHASVAELRQFLGGSLPDYMLPERIVVLSAIPTLASGKVDRSKLPLPGRERPDLGNPILPPRTLLEQSLVRIWEEILSIEGIGADDDFFDLGGNSLKVAAAILRIADVLKSRVSYREFFQNPTPSGIAGCLTRNEHEAGNCDLDPIVPTGSLSGPCGPNQRSLWLLTRTTPNVTAYNMQFTLHFDGELDEDALKAVLGDIVRRHAILRSVVRAEAGEPALSVEKEPLEPKIEVVDFRELDAGSIEGETALLKQAESSQVFLLDRAPLYRFTLIRCPENRSQLVTTVHHVVFDGASINVFCEELVSRYRVRTAGGGAQDLPDGIQYFDYLAWQERLFSGKASDELAAFWRKELEGCSSTLSFPTDYIRPALQSFKGARETLDLSQDESARLSARCRELGATPFMTMFAAYVILLHRYSNQNDILVGCPVANRAHPGAESLIGFFTNLVVLRTRLESGQSFRQLLNQVRETSLRAFEHQTAPFETVLEVCRPERSLSRTPLFQVLFALHEPLFTGLIDESLRMSVVEDGNPGAKYDLALEAHRRAEGMELSLTYSTDLFAAPTMRRFLRQFVCVLNKVLDAPDQDLRELELVSAEESRTIVEEWNRTTFDNARDRCLHRLFEDQAAQTPDRIAVAFNEKGLSYANLNRRANQLAHHLIARGVRAETPVGLSMEISEDLIVAILAILKAGGTYVPLDPFYPLDRIAYIIADSGLSLIISHQSLRDANRRREADVIWLDLDSEAISGMATENPETGVNPDHLIYLMYTSGSTGEPKGVMVPHRGACNYVLWMKHRFPLAADDRVLNKTSINFDISVWEIFLPLISGAQLVLGEREALQGAESLAGLIGRHGVTQVQFVPSAMKSFADSGMLGSCSSLRRIFLGGETLSAGLQAQVFEAFAGELHNLYGPTEASIYVSHWECRRDDRNRLVPIGRPMHNSQLFILDERMQPTPIGMTGELYIGGDSVLARGYRNKPEVTAERFVSNPRSANGKNTRLFKTGDLARYRSDGAIEFLGRADTQVKVRGYRIELGEIEHNLLRHPQVKHAVVIVREDAPDDHRLVAYLLYRDRNGPEESELRAHLKQQIPDYMIPAHFVELDSIPLLPNNKIDLKALPPPSYRKKLDSIFERNYGSDIERTLAEMWEELLVTPKFGLDDNFFDVGGHSLLMVRLQRMIHDRLKLEVSNLSLFQYPTIRSLAAYCKNSSSGNDLIAAEMMERARRRQKRVRIRPLQQNVDPTKDHEHGRR